MRELRPRVIPCLLLRQNTLVKTVRFQSPRYVGDPINVVNIFNELAIDELVILDTTASLEGASPGYEQIGRIASEAFVPLSYGGGVRTVADAEKILRLGVEKIVINSAVMKELDLISELAHRFGSQAVVASIDAKQTGTGYDCFALGGTQALGKSPRQAARDAQQAGAGEILLQSIDRDGTYRGYDLALVREVSSAVGVPVVACGGAKDVADLVRVVRDGGASAAAAGSLFVFQSEGAGVLVNYPSESELASLFSS